MRIELKGVPLMIASMFIANALIGCMLAVICMKKVFPTPQIAKVDLQALVARASNRLSLQEVSESELKTHVRTFTDQLKSELQQLASQKKLIILNASMVIEGAQDITPVIEERLHAGSAQEKP